MPALAASRLPIRVVLRPWLPRHAGMAISRCYRTGTSASRPTTQSSRPASSSAPPRESKPSASPSALRTAEARESALRAARLRRQAQEQDRQAEAAQRAMKKQRYERRYKAAGRRWISSMIALPIALVTSYYLFDRLVLGHEQKEMPRSRSQDGER